MPIPLKHTPAKSVPAITILTSSKKTKQRLQTRDSSPDPMETTPFHTPPPTNPALISQIPATKTAPITPRRSLSHQHQLQCVHSFNNQQPRGTDRPGPADDDRWPIRDATIPESKQPASNESATTTAPCHGRRERER
ncbi:hypothetical protein KC19_3G161200, partial [Ceratodon purpureus]